MLCKSSTGKVFGEAFLDDTKILVRHCTKPELVITDSQLIERIKLKDYSVITVLYDEYFLSLGEIAALFDLKYFQAYSIFKTLDIHTDKSAGRRNSSFGLKFGEERLEKLRKAHKGHTPVGYVRTPEIKAQIAETLKRKHASGEIIMDPQKYSDAWARGCYDTAKMGRGIQGFFYSHKMQRDFYFRSLLELNYFLLMEQEPMVLTYRAEPFQIKLSEVSHYTPDMLVNDKWLLEFKSKGHLRYTSDVRFEQEIQAATEFCKTAGLQFKVLYDTDINFETVRFKRYIKNNPNIVKQFNIRFNDESRVYK